MTDKKTKYTGFVLFMLSFFVGHWKQKELCQNKKQKEERVYRVLKARVEMIKKQKATLQLKKTKENKKEKTTKTKDLIQLGVDEGLGVLSYNSDNSVRWIGGYPSMLIFLREISNAPEIRWKHIRIQYNPHFKTEDMRFDFQKGGI